MCRALNFVVISHQRSLSVALLKESNDPCSQDRDYDPDREPDEPEYGEQPDEARIAKPGRRERSHERLAHQEHRPVVL
jgi:hypothetical protein